MTVAAAIRPRLVMPSETAPHEATVMCWPRDEAVWGSGDRLRAVQEDWGRVAAAIARHEPLVVLAAEDVAEAARAGLPAGARLVVLPVDDAWARDTLPTFVRGPKGRVAVGWGFNVWGEKFPGYEADREAAGALAEALGLPFERASVVTEGGALHVDGAGTLFVTETSVLNDNRNPGLSKAEAEAAFQTMLGVAQVVWLPGNPDEFITDGHIDGILFPVGPGRLIAELPADDGSEQGRIGRENLRALRLARDAGGRPFEIAVLRRPSHTRVESEWFCDSYVNCATPNGAVILPAFGDAQTDATARRVFAYAFPDRQVTQVEIDHICSGGGGIHCITQQIPA